MSLRRSIGVLLFLSGILFGFISIIISGALYEFDFIRNVYWSDITQKYQLYENIKDISGIDTLVEYLEQNQIDYNYTSSATLNISGIDAKVNNKEVEITDSKMLSISQMFKNTEDSTILYLDDGTKLQAKDGKFIIVNNHTILYNRWKMDGQNSIISIIIAFVLIRLGIELIFHNAAT